MRNYRLPAIRGYLAFTLIEVIASSAILVIIVSAVFSLVRGTMITSSTITFSSIRQQELNGLHRLLNTNLRSLPITATLTYGPDDSASRDFAVLKISNAPRAFAWGARPESRFDVLIGVRKQLGSGLTLAIARPPTSASRDAQEKIRWLPLLRDISEIKWRFFDGRALRWQDDWRDSSFRPSLIELNLILADMPEEPQKFVFWLPPIQI